MNSAMQFSETLESEQPVFISFWSGLCAFFRRSKSADTAAGWPDELNAHYLRDAGLEHGAESTLSEPTVYALRVGPRAP
jgi:hypothetical protein